MEKRQLKKELKEILALYNNKKEGLLLCLHKIYKKWGYLPKDIALFLAKETNLASVKIYSLYTFYSLFKRKKEAKYHIKICKSLPCYFKGKDKLLKFLCKKLNVKPNCLTQDKKFLIEEVPCLGMCDKAPFVLINDVLYEKLTIKKLERIIEKLK
ncbi:MAG: NAD(P)H-dependent oxidoreductase subunit E [Candidatus Omnitrophica bacterium]|nr:NAD(P)H-dependent oxidoreductase subunit E [Candidatus Omnitrophota bacterium]